jgi:superfamily II DNA or RNA helicase
MIPDMKQTTLVIRDQVNVKFDGLDPFTRRKVSEALKFFVPYARHMPAFKLGRWDGKVGFATVGGGTYLNLLDRVLPLVMEEGYEIDIDDHRQVFTFDFPEVTEDMFAKQGKVWPEGHPIAGEPVMLRDYQCDAIRTYLANLQSIQSISTGAGKTLLTASLSAIVEPYGRSIIIVPSKSLVEQTEEDYRNLGLDVGVFYGDRKEWGKKHTICTWQSLAVFSKKEKRGELDALGITMADFLEEVVCVMVDETHSAKANELKELLCGPMANIPIRWGLTGTVPKEEYEYLSLVVSLGPVVGEIRAKELQDKGVLSNCHVDILQMIDDVDYTTYHDEYEYLCSDKARLTWISEYVQALAETGNTVILVDRIETGKFLAENIPGASFINGNVKTKDRSKEYKSVQGADDKIIIATYGVAAVGINIPRIFNLVLMEAGKSFVRVIQSIGRGIRKAHDKDFVHITDLCSTAKFSGRHVTKRRAFYKDADYPNATRKVDWKKLPVSDAIRK